MKVIFFCIIIFFSFSSFADCFVSMDTSLSKYGFPQYFCVSKVSLNASDDRETVSLVIDGLGEQKLGITYVNENQAKVVALVKERKVGIGFEEARLELLLDVSHNTVSTRDLIVKLFSCYDRWEHIMRHFRTIKFRKL